MKRFILLIITVFIFENQSLAVTYNSNPKIFVTELVNDAIKILSDKSTSAEKKSASIEKIALENVDIDALGMYTLGELRKIEPNLKENALGVFNIRNSINSKKSYGGTSFDNIKKMIMKYKKEK